MSTGYKKPMDKEDALQGLTWLFALLQRDRRWGNDGGYPPLSCDDALRFSIEHFRKGVSPKECERLDNLFEDIYFRHPKNPNHPDKIKLNPHQERIR